MASESSFIDSPQWDACIDPDHLPYAIPDARLFIGIDLGLKHDATAVCAVCWSRGKVYLYAYRLWHGSVERPVDLRMVEEYVLDLRRRASVAKVLIDPYQAAVTCAAKSCRCGGFLPTASPAIGYNHRL